MTHVVYAVGLIFALTSLTACQGFGTRYRVVPSRDDGTFGAEGRQQAIEIAEGLARRHGWTPLVTQESLEKVALSEDRVLLAQFGHKMRSVPVPGGYAKMSLSVSSARDGSALYFHLLDLSNASETDYVQGIREELRCELEGAFGEDMVTVEYRLWASRLSAQQKAPYR